MRIRIALFFTLLATLLAACKSSHGTGGVVRQVTGGDTIIGASYDSVCMLYVVLPNDEMNMPQEPIWCAGTLIAPDIVLTAASCVEENLTAGTTAGITISCGTDVNEDFGAAEVKLHRYYRREAGSVDDLALVRLDGTP